jgi:hypothetical protein
MLAFGVVPDFLYESFVALDAELNDNIDEQVQKTLDVGPREIAAALILFDQQHQLFEGQLGAGRVHTGNGPGVA